MKPIYPIMFILFLATVAAGVLTAGAAAALFLSLPSLLVVVLISLFLSLCTFSPAEIVRYFAIAFRKEGSEESELRAGIVFFRSLQWYLIAAGLIGFFIGFITIMAGLNSASSIGGGLAIALLTVLYSLLLAAGVAVPFRAGLERKMKSV